ncbi:MAG: hypothetical protein RL216_2559 [Pseudomonadota bacterium]|jgi:hypothetical protein
MLDLLSDILLGAGAFGAAIYCHVLSRRLQRFNALESGMGGAIAVLSAQVDEMTRSLDKARAVANGSSAELTTLVQRAEASAERLDLLVATLHDLPDETASDPPKSRRVTRRRRTVEYAE